VRRTRVSILEGGSLSIDGYKVYWNRGPGGDIRFPVYSVLVDHEDGLFVYDTGFDLKHMQTHVAGDQPLQTPEQTLPAQLAKLGLRPDQVTHVLDSHLHIDHAGGNKHFPNATFVVHEKEREAAKTPQLFERMSYSDLVFDPDLDRLRAEPPKPDEKRPKYQLFSGDLEFAKGVWLLETLGHSAGHYSLLVELAGRKPMLFTGDASMTPRNLQEMIIGGFHLDPVKATASLQRLKDVQAQYDAEFFYSHSMPEYLGWRKAPDWHE
jgi:4-pyridoxolactonase